MAVPQLESGIEAYRNGDKPRARAIFLEIIKLNPQDEAAWLWLSACTDVKEQQVYCLNKVLSLNPNNAHAQKGLAVIAALPSSADPASSIQSSEQPVISVQQSTESKPSSLPEVSVTVRHTIDGVKSELRKIGVGKLLMSIINKQLLVETLEDNEQIEHAAQGKYKGDVVVLVVTKNRILLISIAPKNFVHKIPYNSISSVQQRSGFAMGILNIISNGSIFEITDIVDNKKSIEIHRLITININLIKEEGDGKSLDTITADQIRLTQMKRQIPLFTMKGIQDVLEVYEDKVTITPSGMLGMFNKGAKGTKTIPFSSITAIQFKKPGFTNGYLQFTLTGGVESRGGVFDATKDENTVMFGAKETAIVEEIKNHIESQMQKLRTPQNNSSSDSLASELERLADLKSKGILTEEEFQTAKKRLLG